MSRIVPGSVAAIGLMLCLATTVEAQDTLRWRYRAGDAWSYRLTQVQEVQAQVMGQNMNQSQTQTTDVTLRVAAVDPSGTATVDWTYDRIRMHMQAMGMTVDWDSDNPNAGGMQTPMGAGMQSLGALVGHTITVVMTSRGEVQEVRGMDELMDAVLDAMDPAMRPMLEEQFRAMFGEQQIRSSFMSGLGVFPEGPVTAGASWQAGMEMALPMMGTMRTDLTNSVVSVGSTEGERRATLEQRGSISLDSSAGGQNPMGMPMNVHLEEGRLSGSVDFSVDRGLIVRSETQSSMSITMSMGGGQGRQQQGMNIAQSINSTVTFELVGAAESGGGTRPQSGF